jgi:hypothetical protein
MFWFRSASTGTSTGLLLTVSHVIVVVVMLLCCDKKQNNIKDRAQILEIQMMSLIGTHMSL